MKHFIDYKNDTEEMIRIKIFFVGMVLGALSFCLASLIFCPVQSIADELPVPLPISTIAINPEVSVQEQTVFQKPDFNYNVNNNFTETLAPANLEGNHYLNKCDSDAVKKRAHQWGFMGYQKKLDVQMQTSLLTTCEKLVNVDPAQAVACIREYGDQQREQRKDVATGITSGINAFSLGLQVIKSFRKGF